MDDNEFNDYFNNRYMNQQEWYSKKARQNKKWYKRIQFTLITFAAITPILIVIDYIAENLFYLRWISVISAILVTITASSLKGFKYQENWVQYRTTAEMLKKEKYYYKADINHYEKATDKKKLFVNRVEELISSENRIWQTISELGKEQ